MCNIPSVQVLKYLVKEIHLLQGHLKLSGIRRISNLYIALTIKHRHPCYQRPSRQDGRCVTSTFRLLDMSSAYETTYHVTLSERLQI